MRQLQKRRLLCAVQRLEKEESAIRTGGKQEWCGTCILHFWSGNKSLIWVGSVSTQRERERVYVCGVCTCLYVHWARKKKKNSACRLWTMREAKDPPEVRKGRSKERKGRKGKQGKREEKREEREARDCLCKGGWLRTNQTRCTSTFSLLSRFFYFFLSAARHTTFLHMSCPGHPLPSLPSLPPPFSSLPPLTIFLEIGLYFL